MSNKVDMLQNYLDTDLPWVINKIVPGEIGDRFRFSSVEAALKFASHWESDKGLQFEGSGVFVQENTDGTEFLLCNVHQFANFFESLCKNH